MRKLAKRLRKLLDKDIVDIIIFGSSAKNKLKANDFDIAIILKDGIDGYAIKKKIREEIGMKADVQVITIEDYAKFIWVTLIREGFSVKEDKYLHDIYRINPVILFKYSLKQLPVSKKVMFERAIKNVKNIQKLSNRVVLVPIQHSEEFSDLLRHWDMDFETQEYGLLPFVRKGQD